MSADDLDEVHELRFALWGEVDDATSRVAERIAAAPPGDALPTRCEAHRRFRDVVRRIDAAATPPELRAWLRREVEERRPPLRDFAAGWMHATPHFAAAGGRGGAGDRLLACTFPDLEVQAELTTDPAGTSAAVTGRLVGRDREPLAGRTVTFVVDRRSRAACVTDEFGEFTFEPVAGTWFGLRVAAGETSHHVVLVDLAAEASEDDAAG